MRRRLRRFLLPYWIGCFCDVALSQTRPGACFSNQSFEDPLHLLQSILHFLQSLYSPEGLRELIRSGGTVLVCTIVFIETGFFVGFFLPGDSLLVTAGVFAASGQLHISELVLLVPLCAIAGDQIGYWIGRKAGQALYSREDSLIFRKQHLQRAQKFYEKYGGKTVILARFVPVVR